MRLFQEEKKIKRNSQKKVFLIFGIEIQDWNLNFCRKLFVYQSVKSRLFYVKR